MNGRILIVDDVATNRIVYQARLAAAFYQPMLASDAKSCLQRAGAERPDLILLDLTLPDMAGTEVLKILRSQPQTCDIPVIVLTATRGAEARMAAFSAGADDVLTKPATETMLLARVRNLLRLRVDTEISAVEPLQIPGFCEPVAEFKTGVSPPRRATIALLASHSDATGRWLLDLEGQSGHKVVVMSRSQALAEAARAEGEGIDVPDIYIIPDDINGRNGALRLLSELKSHIATRHSAVCVVAPTANSDGAAMAFDLGADDVVDPDISGQELVLRMRSLLRRKQQGDRQRATLQDSVRLAMTDPLTGLHNRRYAMPRLSGIAARSEAERRDFAVMVVDLDKFKLVNDHYGHAAGDQVLVQVAKRLTQNLRLDDMLARIGGEEFLVVLPSTSMAEAQQVADRLCAAVKDVPIRLVSGQTITVTVSIGVAVFASGVDRVRNVEALFEQADLALLESKTSGRNQVTFRLTAA